MKTITLLLAAFIAVTACSCSGSGSKTLFNGTDNDLWEVSGNVSMENSRLILNGKGAEAILKHAEYKDFELSLEMRTTPLGKGYIGFHTDRSGKGYKIAVSNNKMDPQWWRLTGSLMSVRNLTKDFVREGDWFNLKIRAEGQLITVAINGQPVVEYIQPAKPYRTAANSQMLLSEGTFSLVSTGPGAIEFKEIKVEALNAKDININGQLAMAQDEQSDEIIRLHQEDFPVLDYHVHLKGGLTKETAARQSRRTGVNYAIAPNCGIGFAITNDQEVSDFINEMRDQPFILAMQGEGREWPTTFSQKVRDQFDFVFTDALTFTDHNGRRVRLWVNETVVIDNEQRYMDMIVDRMCTVLEEPFDIYVNPFFLPEAMNDRYDYFWTDKRVDRVITKLVETGKVLELNELYQIPSKKIVLKAKEAGIKFSFGTNNVTPEVSNLEHSIRMKKECGLTAENMHNPYIKICKDRK